MRFAPLGGCGEFGLHSTLVRAGATAICVDAGLGFPDDDAPGIEQLVPDFGALAAEPVAAYFLTHGHEDHTGGLSWALRVAPAPVYGTPLTLALARTRLEEAGAAGRAELRAIAPTQTVRVGELEVRAVAVRHSVPGAVGYVVTGGGRRLFVTGDHKGLDEPPPTGIDAMLADSTGALREGRTPPEGDVTRALAGAVDALPKGRRLVVAMFATHVERLENLLALCARAGRAAALCGRKLIETADAARRLGLLRATWGDLARAEVVVASGGQGEGAAALARIAREEHPDVQLAEGDRVLFSGRPILGNERAVARVQDALAARGVEILDGPELHASGHGSRGDLTDLMEAVRPGCVVPLHGAERHLRAHAALARAAGFASALAHNGDLFEIDARGTKAVGRVSVGRICLQAGMVVPASALAARVAAGRGGVVILRPGGAELVGVTGIDAREVADAAVREGPDAAARLVRRRTGQRPLVVPTSG
jgi:ribonuclease J